MTSMKDIFRTSLITFFLLIWFSGIRSQSIAFEENFESAPVTSLWNSLDDTLWTGSSWCGQAARGMTSHHNSSDVDFLNGQNNSYFLANNPQDSCGGANTAIVETDTFDFSTYDSLFFSCSYFIGDSIGWGMSTLRFDIMTPNDTFSIDTVFTDTSQWSSVIDLRLPNSMLDDTTSFEIELGGGEAVGVDNIVIYEPFSSSLLTKKKRTQEKLQVHPNPVTDRVRIEDPALEEKGTRIRLLDMTGKELRNFDPGGSVRVTRDLSAIPKGVYILELRTEEGQKRSERVIKK